MGLNQGQQLEHLVQRAEAAWADDHTGGILDEHRLPDKEVPEAHAKVHPLVQPLFKRKFDAKPHRLAARQCRSPVRGFHNARPATSDDGDIALGDLAAHATSRLVVRFGALCARGAENRYRRPQLGKRTEAIHEFGLDAQHTPRIHMQPIGILIRLEQVRGGVVRRNHLTAQNHRASMIGVPQRRGVLRINRIHRNLCDLNVGLFFGNCSDVRVPVNTGVCRLLYTGCFFAIGLLGFFPLLRHLVPP